MSHSPKHCDEITSLFSTSCPFGELSVRQNVRSAKYPFGKTSVRQNDRGQNVRSAKCLSAKCLSAKCPGTPVRNHPASAISFLGTFQQTRVTFIFCVVRTLQNPHSKWVVHVGLLDLSLFGFVFNN